MNELEIAKLIVYLTWALATLGLAAAIYGLGSFRIWLKERQEQRKLFKQRQLPKFSIWFNTSIGYGWCVNPTESRAVASKLKR